MKAHQFPIIEALEARIAPASLTGHILTYTDVDGDAVKVTFSGFTPLLGIVTFKAGSTPVTEEIDKIDLSGFSGASFSLVATPHAGHGDSHANVGSLTAAGTDLGTVSIDGDLTNIQAGDTDPKLPGIRSLTVHSMGEVRSSFDSTIISSGAGKIAIKTNIVNAFLGVQGKVGSISVGGSLIGTANDQSGYISLDGEVGSIKIGGSLISGAGRNTALVMNTGSIKSLIIRGSLIGTGHGGGDFGAAIGVGATNQPAGIGSLIIGGDIVGGNLAGYGSVDVSGTLGSMVVGGSIRGGSARFTGGVDAGAIGKMTVGHDLVGGTSSKSGYVSARGTIGNAIVGGSILGDSTRPSESALLSAGGVLGTVVIGGDLDHGVIEGDGFQSVAGIKNVTIKGSVRTSSIVAGAATVIGATQVNVNAGIGTLHIVADLLDSRIAVGLNASDTATIGLIKIGGSATGSATTDSGIIATNLAKIQVGAAAYLQPQLIGAGLKLGINQAGFGALFQSRL